MANPWLAIEVEGERGEYRIDGDYLDVRSEKLGMKRAGLQGTQDPAMIARLVLRELRDAYKPNP